MSRPGTGTPSRGTMAPMAINIKNPQVCALIRRAAERTGRPQTTVLEEALERYLRAMDDSAAGGAGLEETLARIDAILTGDDRAAIRADLESLYDDQGLPA